MKIKITKAAQRPVQVVVNGQRHRLPIMEEVEVAAEVAGVLENAAGLTFEEVKPKGKRKAAGKRRAKPKGKAAKA